MRPTAALVALSVLTFAGNMLTNLTSQENQELLNAVGDVSFIVAAFCASAGFWTAYTKMPKITHLMRQYLLWTFMAFTLFMFGDIYWAYGELVLKTEVPIGSAADFFWTLAYLTLFVGVFKALSTIHLPLSKSQKRVIVLSGLVTGIYTVIHFSHIPAVHGWVILIQDMYPAYDVILIGFLLTLLMPALSQGLKRFVTTPLGLFALAVFIRIIFDTAFAYTTANGTYYTGHLIDTFYTGSYVVAAIAADQHLKNYTVQKPAKK